MNRVQFTDLGMIDYKQAWDYQEEIFEQVKAEKQAGLTAGKPLEKQTMIFCEHPHVYTLGKSGQANNLLITDEFMERIGASYYHINRGGDITYHGPGQIVGYPIFSLESMKIKVKEFIWMLEESIIGFLKEYNVVAGRLNGATGVWLEPEEPAKARKICAIGVRLSNYVSMHGFALNLNTDLRYFDYINPCGFNDKAVTSLQKESGHLVHMDEAKKLLKNHIARTFTITWKE